MGKLKTQQGNMREKVTDFSNLKVGELFYEDGFRDGYILMKTSNGKAIILLDQNNGNIEGHRYLCHKDTKVVPIDATLTW